MLICDIELKLLLLDSEFDPCCPKIVTAFNRCYLVSALLLLSFSLQNSISSQGSIDILMYNDLRFELSWYDLGLY